jgi:hypothetical protein
MKLKDATEAASLEPSLLSLVSCLLAFALCRFYLLCLLISPVLM